MLQQLLTVDALLVAVGAVVLAGIWGYRTFSKQSWELKQQRLVFIQDLAYGAWSFIDGIAAGTATSVDDKLALALKKVADSFAAQTGKPLPERDAAAAKLRLEHIAGQQAQQAKAQTPSMPR